MPESTFGKDSNLDIKIIQLATEEKSEQLDRIFSELRTLYQNSDFILGKAVQKFEAAFSKEANCSYGIGVNSGTDAILLSLRALGIGLGDEVITAANSYVATAGAIVMAGATPVFADVTDDYNLCPASVEAAVTSRTRAIIPVHLTGNPCQMDPLLETARKHDLAIIEDAAQAIGAVYKGRKVGGFGAAGCFSLHPLKNLHVWGDGGMITTNSAEFADTLKKHRNHGHKNRDEVEFFSYNSRLDSVQAIVGLFSLELMEQTIAKRGQNAKVYDERLSRLDQYIQRPQFDRSNVEHAYHLYVVRAQDRDLLKKFLEQKGIETKVHYPIPIHLQEAAVKLGYRKGSLPVTERLSGEILSLPIRESLSSDQIHQVCDLLEQFYL